MSSTKLAMYMLLLGAPIFLITMNFTISEKTRNKWIVGCFVFVLFVCMLVARGYNAAQ